jgi:hypothetical protein
MQHTYGHSPGGIHNCFAWAEQAGYIWYDKQLNLWYITSMGYKLTGKNQPYPAIILFKKSGVNKKLAALAAKYNTGICDIVNPAVRAGRCILARGEFFWYLHDRGLPYSFIAERYNFGIERVREIVAKHKAITNRGKA